MKELISIPSLGLHKSNIPLNSNCNFTHIQKHIKQQYTHSGVNEDLQK